MANTEAEKFIARWQFAGYKARCFIQGTMVHPKTRSVEPHSGNWSEELLAHPTVQLAEAEGWSKDLRSALFEPIRLRIMEGKPHAILNDYMPSEKWIAVTRERIAVEQRAQAWQAEMMDRYGTMPHWTAAVARQLSDAQPQMANKRTTFKPASAGLTPRSKAMAGDE